MVVVVVVVVVVGGCSDGRLVFVMLILVGSFGSSNSSRPADIDDVFLSRQLIRLARREARQVAKHKGARRTKSRRSRRSGLMSTVGKNNEPRQDDDNHHHHHQDKLRP